MYKGVKNLKQWQIDIVVKWFLLKNSVVWIKQVEDLE